MYVKKLRDLEDASSIAHNMNCVKNQINFYLSLL